ncbi:MAG: hypothetical protein RIB84_15405 [Sneathiellaceae bacterium]
MPEAMTMRHEFVAAIDGTVLAIDARVGSQDAADKMIPGLTPLDETAPSVP